MKLTVGQLIGKALKAYGVPYVTGLPGHGNWSTDLAGWVSGMSRKACARASSHL